MSDIIVKAVIKNPDGSLFYRQEEEWPDLSPEQEAVIYEMLGKQKNFLDDLKENQKKTPDAVLSATLSATGQPDLYYDAFTYDSFQKAYHNWNKVGDEVLRMGERRIKGKPT
jgi:hypothetical protein